MGSNRRKKELGMQGRHARREGVPASEAHENCFLRVWKILTGLEAPDGISVRIRQENCQSKKT